MWYLIWIVGMVVLLAACICGVSWMERKQAFDLMDNDAM